MKNYITKAELISAKACLSGLTRFISQTNNTDEPVLITSLIGGKNTATDLLWLADKICTAEKMRSFARDVALVNIELIKPECSEADYAQILNSLKTGKKATRAAHAAVHAASVVAAARAAVAAARATNTAAAAALTAAAIAVVAACVSDGDAVAAAYTYAASAGQVDFTPCLQELFS